MYSLVTKVTLVATRYFHQFIMFGAPHNLQMLGNPLVISDNYEHRHARQSNQRHQEINVARDLKEQS